MSNPDLVAWNMVQYRYDIDVVAQRMFHHNLITTLTASLSMVSWLVEAVTMMMFERIPPSGGCAQLRFDRFGIVNPHVPVQILLAVNID